MPNMAGTYLKLIEQARARREELDCVEIYMPKRMAFLSELYTLLREKVNNPLHSGWPP